MTLDPNLNALWARCIAEELHRAGCTRAILCPGSRNSPLVFALATVLGNGCISHTDERSAAFLALGMIKVTGKPAVVCVTSGSALANCLPALTEAHATGLPLMILAADRPWELHDTGAPQSMPQAHGLSAWLTHEVALGEPTLDDRALRVLRARISRAAQMAGPVLINVPLREPLPPLPERGFATAQLSTEALVGRVGAPFTDVVEPFAEHLTGTATWSEPAWLRPGLRGLIVVGATAEAAFDPKPVELSEATGFPLIADAASGLRGCNLPGLVTLADALVTGALAQDAPELVIQIGPAPLSRAVYEWLDRQAPRWIVLESHGGQDWLARAELAIRRPGIQAYRSLAARCGRGDETWRTRWISAETAARSRLAIAMHAAKWGEPVAAHLALSHPGFAFIAIGNSMAARHANLHVLSTAAPRPMVTTRGVAGIDGNCGTFLGAAKELGRGLLLCGDLTALHDLPALAALPNLPNGGTIVVIDNGGGGIFDYLPVAQVPTYDRWIRANHDQPLAKHLAAYGLMVHEVADVAALRIALDRAALGGWHAIVANLRGLDGVAQHRALIHALATG